MGLLEALVPASVRNAFARPSQSLSNGYKTFTEYSPAFSAFDGNLYEQAQTRAIVERIAIACSKLKPEFVMPEGSNGSAPRLQKLVRSWPNDMMTWPMFLKRVATLYYVDTTAFIVPGYDDGGNVISLWPLKPQHTEVVEYEGEPWLRFFLRNGEVQAFPFYDVVILTRFQLESDVFGGGNKPLTQTLRLMDAQRQAEEIALKTGADIRFIGQLTTLTHEEDLQQKRDRFAEANLGPANKSGLMLYDTTINNLTQIDPQHFVADQDMMERIDKTLYAYFGINESILTNDYSEAQLSAFYEGPIEHFAVCLAEGMNNRYLTAVQRRKGNGFMFSASYLEYATPDSKLKVVSNMMDRGIISVNEARDIQQLPHIEGGDVRMIRGEYYMIDDKNNIVAESGGRTEHDITGRPSSWDTTDDLEEEPDESDDTNN